MQRRINAALWEQQSRLRLEAEIKCPTSEEADEKENIDDIEQSNDDQVAQEQKPGNHSATRTKQRNNSAVKTKFEDNQVPETNSEINVSSASFFACIITTMMKLIFRQQKDLNLPSIRTKMILMRPIVLNDEGKSI